MIRPRALYHEDEFAGVVAEAERRLCPEVQRIRYSIGGDWTGEPAVFFRVVISDAFTGRDQLRKVAERASPTLEELIEPVAEWGVLPYFNFRSQSEQAALQDEAWAW